MASSYSAALAACQIAPAVSIHSIRRTFRRKSSRIAPRICLAWNPISHMAMRSNEAKWRGAGDADVAACAMFHNMGKGGQ
ncbi:hypothetical protein KCP73_22950 [Salmonella enterica subsp. enterica]|nr:hypothetical protein KCP73_22950 [Salmonella enterica subsp. enterica]